MSKPLLTILLTGTTFPDIKRPLFSLLLFAFFAVTAPSPALEVAPRITDREIVERLARLEEGQKALHKRIDDLRSEMIGRFDAISGRFDTLQWTLGLFITISLVILGFVLRLQWQLARRQTQVEATL
jgi:hypothetical protein